MNSRRKFFKSSIAGLAAGPFLDLAGATAKVPNRAMEDPFELAIAGYTFNHFKLDESLAMMARVGVHYLCIKNFHLPYDSTAEEITAFHAKLNALGIKGYAVGPIYMNKTRQEIDDAFDYAKRVGVDLIVGIPKPEDLKYVESKVKETNIRYAIHNHGPDETIFPTATIVYNYVKDLDARVGLCFDMGHDFRDGQDPIADLEKYHTRIFDLHLKNVTAAEKAGTTCELSRGIIDIPAFVKMLRKVAYAGYCALEYEKDMKDPLAGIAESVGYFKGVCDAIK